jgi:hypothetical protein
MVGGSWLEDDLIGRKIPFRVNTPSKLTPGRLIGICDSLSNRSHN